MFHIISIQFFILEYRYVRLIIFQIIMRYNFRYSFLQCIGEEKKSVDQF